MILDEIISSVKQGKNILILGDDVDKITKFYSVLDKEIKDEKEKYITTNLLNSTVEDKEKFSKHFKKNKENFYLTLLKTKIKMPSNYNKFNICDFIKKEFKENFMLLISSSSRVFNFLNGSKKLSLIFLDFIKFFTSSSL